MKEIAISSYRLLDNFFSMRVSDFSNRESDVLSSDKSRLRRESSDSFSSLGTYGFSLASTEFNTLERRYPNITHRMLLAHTGSVGNKTVISNIDADAKNNRMSHKEYIILSSLGIEQPQIRSTISQAAIPADKPPMRDVVGSNFIDIPIPITNANNKAITIFQPSLNLDLAIQSPDKNSSYNLINFLSIHEGLV